MSILQAIVLGIVQGLTEFLPVSSSAHLIFIPMLLNWPQPGLAFDMALHLGTLVAVVTYFRRDLFNMALALPRGLLSGRPLADPHSRLAILVLIGCLPAAVAGLLLEKSIEHHFYSDDGVRQSLVVIALAMIGLALLLALVERYAKRDRTLEKANWRDAVVIGLAQTLALIPGVSRSGSTITAGLGVGLDRPAAARYSFLMGTPLILAAALKQIYNVWRDGATLGDGLVFGVGFAISAVVGYGCIRFLLRYLQTHSNAVFIGYRIVIGVLLLTYSFAR